VPSMAGVDGASMPPDSRRWLPGIEEEEGCCLMGKLKRSDAAVIFPPVEVVEADHGGGVRPTGGAGLRTLLRCGRRKKTTAWPCGLKGRMGRLAAGPIGPKVEGKILF
jgi:hypothetical protein